MTGILLIYLSQTFKGGVNVYSNNDGDSSPFWFGEESPLI